MKRARLGDGWYESEEPTRLALVSELQRIKQRTLVRPLPVLVLAALITGAVVYKFALKPRIYSAQVVLAVTEGEVEDRHSIPFDELKQYVSGVLLPDAKLTELIEARNLHRLRKKLGAQYAIDELRGQLEVEIWKNTFVYFHEEEENARKSARIGLTIEDTDPDLAFGIARDLAGIVIETHEEQRRLVSEALAKQVETMRAQTSKKLNDLDTAIAVKTTALAKARKTKHNGLAAVLLNDTVNLANEARRTENELSLILRSPEAVADRVTAAGLGTRIDIVEERRPLEVDQTWIVLAMIIIVIGTGALVGSALFVGAFDSRVHDTDDVARLGLPVLGHVPGFQGDHVGSLEARGARRARVPSWLRWRS